MPIYKTEIWSGDVYEAEIYFSPRIAGKSIRRGANRETSCLKQQENNLRNARKKLARLINSNFSREDIFVTLTYADEPGGEANRHLANFFRRERYRRRRAGEPELKYIAVTENNSTRTHHHIIMNSAAITELVRLWPHGRVILSALDNDADYTGLAHYITKENGQGKRWSQSRNLQKPKVRRREIKSRTHRLRAPKGYQLRVDDFYYSEATGGMSYIKAVRLGGMDLAVSLRRRC